MIGPVYISEEDFNTLNAILCYAQDANGNFMLLHETDWRGDLQGEAHITLRDKLHFVSKRDMLSAREQQMSRTRKSTLQRIRERESG